MPFIIEYLLKLNICLTVIYFFYKLLLRRLTFYNWNRWYFLGYTALSFIIPLINIMPSLEKRALHQNVVVQWIPVINFSNSDKGFFETLTYWDWALGILLLGTLVLFVRFLFRFYSFKKLKKRAKLISDSETQIYQLEEPIAPFSFGNAIFVNLQSHSEQELQEIIKHEFVHVKQKHTLDIMWCELICIINWFNPFVWMIKHDVKQNLEFIADNQVLQNGVDKKAYQYLLLKVMGNVQFAFTNQFNFSSLKKRIAMMNSFKSAKVQLVKFVFLLPVVTVLLLSFRKEAITPNAAAQTVMAHKEAESSRKTLYTKVIKLNENAANPVLKKVIVENQKTISAKTVKDTIPEKKNVMQTDSSKRLLSQFGKALIIVNGEYKGPSFNLNSLNPEEFESIEVLKSESARAIYGEKARNGVVLIEMKKEKNSTAAILGMDSVYYILNGEPANADEIKKIDENTIKSVDVLKDETAKKYYGSKAKNGAIIITTK